MDSQTRPAPVPASLQAGAEDQQDQLAVNGHQSAVGGLTGIWERQTSPNKLEGKCCNQLPGVIQLPAHNQHTLCCVIGGLQPPGRGPVLDRQSFGPGHTKRINNFASFYDVLF